MEKVVIAGVQGKMGRALIDVANEDTDVKIVFGAGRQSDVANKFEFPFISDLDETNGAFDVLIDFTSPKATMAHLRWCAKHKKAMVIGTTGFDSEQRKEMASLAKLCPVVHAVNFSIGMHALKQLVAQASRLLMDSADIEITESHHRFKKDAPSGSALELGELVAAQKGKSLEEVAAYSRQNGARQDGDIGFSVIRGGDIFGEHTVMFALNGERIELSHKAASRQCFAKGAYQCAKWLKSQAAGLYSLDDVIG